MKTILLNNRKLPLRCENTGRRFYSLFSSLASSVSLDALIRLKSLNLMDALRICRDGLDAYRRRLTLAVKEAWSNKRLRFGLLVGLVALPAWKCHRLFDVDQRDFTWYYINYAVYFNSIRAYLVGIFLSLGFFIALPQKWAFKWFSLPVITFCAIEIYNLSFYTDWKDFYRDMPDWEMWSIILVTVPAVLLSINYLVYRKYHLKDGNIARIIGMIDSPGLTWEEKGPHLEKLSEEFKNFNARI